MDSQYGVPHDLRRRIVGECGTRGLVDHPRIEEAAVVLLDDLEGGDVRPADCEWAHHALCIAAAPDLEDASGLPRNRSMKELDLREIRTIESGGVSGG
jgi:hypothetical protein